MGVINEAKRVSLPPSEHIPTAEEVALLAEIRMEIAKREEL